MISIMNGIAFSGMNLEVWNSLPPDIQKILDDLNPWAQELANDSYNAFDDVATKLCTDDGDEFITLAPEEKARWIQTTDYLVDEENGALRLFKQKWPAFLIFTDINNIFLENRTINLTRVLGKTPIIEIYRANLKENMIIRINK